MNVKSIDSAFINLFINAFVAGEQASERSGGLAGAPIHYRTYTDFSRARREIL